MGFIKKNNYNVNKLGIELPTAYAKIAYITIDASGNAHATFNIQQTREDVINKNPLERVNITALVDKTQPIYSQLYVVAKETKFVDWEDDIVEVEEIDK